MARLSTHVLDTSRGRPAANVPVELHAISNGQRSHLKTAATNPDGRAEILPSIDAGVYELTFHAGEYFRKTGVELPDPAFLDEIVIRFGVADPAGSYHVPLLLSPYGYSTYRGS